MRRLIFTSIAATSCSPVNDAPWDTTGYCKHHRAQPPWHQQRLRKLCIYTEDNYILWRLHQKKEYD